MSPAPDTFRAVYLAHFSFVWASLRRLGIPEQDVLDLTQKVFLVVHLKLSEFEHRALLKTWIYRVCLNTASDYRRSAPIRREVTTDVAELDLLVGSPDNLLWEQNVSRQRLAAAEAILDKLPEAQRVAFVLFELDGMSGQEIADLLDISVGTVRSRLRLARETFLREAKRLSALEHTGRREAV